MPSPTLRPPLSLAHDDRLVELVREGREDAFAELHARYRPALVRFARRLLHGTSHDPEDVVQDAFLSAYSALRAVDRPIALKPWLYMIVRNRAFDQRRSPRDSRSVPDGERALAVVPALTGDPDRAARGREELREVVAAIGRLPDRQRLALVQRAFEGRPLEEVAGGLGATIPATKSLLWRARHDLRSG